jgi:DNA mismatch repair ATPase MutS
VNLALGLDLFAFAVCTKGMRDHRRELRAAFEAVGAVDVALSVARWRAALDGWCRPVFTNSASHMRIRRLAHPLLDEAVPNDLTVEGAGVLVTGSNMSGKTTFIRAVGVNVVLAQSLHTVLAESYEAPELVVRASIGRADDLRSGKSYYLAEVESIGALVAASGTERQQLFLVDEIFRGTNTTERVAAGRAVLAWLARANDIVLVATHDLELLELLDGQYQPFHFREEVVRDELYFDYTIRPGVSSTRNAIALLRLMHFPAALVDDATATAERLAGHGTLARRAT